MVALRPIQASVQLVLGLSLGYKVAIVMPNTHLLLVPDYQCVEAIPVPAQACYRVTFS